MHEQKTCCRYRRVFCFSYLLISLVFKWNQGPDAVNLDDYVGGTFDDGKSRRKLDKKAEALPGWVHR